MTLEEIDALYEDLCARELKLLKQKREFARKQKKKKLTTTKKLITFLFINCIAIQLFTGWAVVQSLKIAEMGLQPVDFTPLVALIGAIVGEVMGFAVYAIKSMRENCKGGVTYECAMREEKDKEAVG